MDIGRFVRQRVREVVDAVDQADDDRTGSGNDVNVVKAVNVARSGGGTAASTEQHIDIVQNGKRTRRSTTWQTTRD